MFTCTAGGADEAPTSRRGQRHPDIRRKERDCQEEDEVRNVDKELRVTWSYSSIIGIKYSKQSVVVVLYPAALIVIHLNSLH